MIPIRYIQSVAKAISKGITPYAYRQIAVRQYGKERGGEMADRYQREYYESKNKPQKSTAKTPASKKSSEKFHDPLKGYLKKEEEEIRRLEREKAKKKKKKDDRELSSMFKERAGRW